MTKYTIPPARPREVVRTRLREKPLTKLTLISAPPGFGKSTLAAGLARASGRRVAWLSLDESDNDPLSFGAYLAAALGLTGLPAFDSLDDLVPLLINAVAADGAPSVLVLDDYHVIESDAIHAAVAFLLDRLPANLRMVIASRGRPPLPLARLKVRGELTEIAAADLRFTPEEAVTFLHEAMGLDLPDEGVAAIMYRTEGWVAGLQLAALSLQGAPDWASALHSFTGHRGDLLDYVVGEVIQQQPAGIQTFLLKTAILSRLSGPLCDALTGQTDGRRTLTALEQANLFVFPLDPERRWFRYHPLFAECLLARLQDEVGDAGVADLHRRAACWLHADGQAADAIDHLLAAGDWNQAADWMEAAFADAAPGGSARALQRWVQELPPAVFAGRPRLATRAAWALIGAGDVETEAQFQRAADYLELAGKALGAAAGAGCPGPAGTGGPGPAGAGEARGVLAAVRTALAPWAPLRQCSMCTLQYMAHAVDCAEEALAHLPAESLFWRSVVKNSLGAVFLRAGDMAGAAQEFGEAARLGARSGDLTAAVAALERQARLLTALGQLRAADAAVREALQLAAEQGGLELPVVAPIFLTMGRLQFERNDLDGAAHSLTEALRRYAAGGQGAPEALLVLARVRQAQGDATTARSLVDQAGDLLGAGPRLRAAGTAAWPDGAAVLLEQGNVAGARHWAALGGAGLEGPPDLWRAAEHIALARVLVAEGQAGAALTLLRSLRDAAVAGGCRAIAAEARVVEALAHHALGDDKAGCGALERALALTAAEGFVRLYAGGGRPMGGLLRQLRQTEASTRGYVERLLAILEGDAPAPAPVAPELAGSITERELEILKLIAVGHSNQDVARELFMSIATVKWHLINIFGKLQVRNRTQAVARARELGLV